MPNDSTMGMRCEHAAMAPTAIYVYRKAFAGKAENYADGLLGKTTKLARTLGPKQAHMH